MYSISEIPKQKNDTITAFCCSHIWVGSWLAFVYVNTMHPSCSPFLVLMFRPPQETEERISYVCSFPSLDASSPGPISPSGPLPSMHSSSYLLPIPSWSSSPRQNKKAPWSLCPAADPERAHAKSILGGRKQLPYFSHKRVLSRWPLLQWGVSATAVKSMLTTESVWS